MSEKFSAHVVAQHLKEVENVDTIFAISGGHVDLILDGCLDHGIRVIDVRHEQAAAMMAHAWSIYRKQPGVCVVTAGPGFTNVITGIANAAQDNIPVVCISGCGRIRDWSRGALQEMKQADVIKSVVKWSDICMDPTRVSEYLAKAFREAVAGRPGPVFLEIPPDVLDQKIDPVACLWKKSGSTEYRPSANPDLVAKALEMIDKAERPFLIGGSGIYNSDCGEELLKFVEKSGIPFALMNTGRGVIPDDHPLSVWDGGMVAINLGLSQADLVIGLGIRFGWLLNQGQAFPDAKLIKVDIEPTELDRNRACDLGIISDLKPLLELFNQSAKEKQLKEWRKNIADVSAQMLEDEIASWKNPSSPIHPMRMVKKVQEAVGDDALYMIDGGDTVYYGGVGVTAKQSAGVILASGGQFGCLGTGIPFAIGAKAAKPEKTIVVITGDGSTGFNIMEFETAVRRNIPFVCVINNDKAWGMIKHGIEIKYGADRLIASELGMVHYEKIVEALGGYGELVDRDEDIVPAIRRAVESGKPACVNIMTDPTAISLATHQFVGSLKKY